MPPLQELMVEAANPISENDLKIELSGFFFEPFDALEPEFKFIMLEALFDVVLSIAEHAIE
jgi:hypothetical protein